MLNNFGTLQEYQPVEVQLPVNITGPVVAKKTSHCSCWGT
jgi:hypothetical protein